MRFGRLLLAGLTSALLIASTGLLAQTQPSPSIISSQVTVQATATQTAIARSSRQAVTIQNHGTTVIYCGPSSSVTTANGFRLPGVDGASLTLPTRATVYCITAGGTQAVSIIESY